MGQVNTEIHLRLPIQSRERKARPVRTWSPCGARQAVACRDGRQQRGRPEVAAPAGPNNRRIDGPTGGSSGRWSQRSIATSGVPVGVLSGSGFGSGDPIRLETPIPCWKDRLPPSQSEIKIKAETTAERYGPAVTQTPSASQRSLRLPKQTIMASTLPKACAQSVPAERARCRPAASMARTTAASKPAPIPTSRGAGSPLSLPAILDAYGLAIALTDPVQIPF